MILLVGQTEQDMISVFSELRCVCMTPPKADEGFTPLRDDTGRCLLRPGKGQCWHHFSSLFLHFTPS